MPRNDSREGSRTRTAVGSFDDGASLNKQRRKLQRIVRNQDLKLRDVSGEFDPRETSSPSLAQKQATLSPELLVPAAVSEDECVQYQCTECDMMVKDSDPYCPFCGAIFADGPLSSSDETAEADEKPSDAPPMIREEFVRPEKFDLFGMMKTRARARELLYQEALNGFAGSARLLEEIEHLISDISSLGTDTTRARRLMGNAWEACREGNWTLVSALARQTEEVMTPSIPSLVRSELARAREYLMDAKAAGVEVSDYVLRMKAAMNSLKANDVDEALRITKDLMDILREDSVSWKKGGSPASRNSLLSIL